MKHTVLLSFLVSISFFFFTLLISFFRTSSFSDWRLSILQRITHLKLNPTTTTTSRIWYNNNVVVHNNKSCDHREKIVFYHPCVICQSNPFSLLWFFYTSHGVNFTNIFNTNFSSNKEKWALKCKCTKADTKLMVKLNTVGLDFIKICASGKKMRRKMAYELTNVVLHKISLNS